MKAEFIVLDCGCRIIDMPEMEQNIVLWPCDLDKEECYMSTWFYMSFKGKPGRDEKKRKSMSPEEVAKHVAAIGKLIQDGYALRDVRTALGIKAS